MNKQAIKKRSVQITGSTRCSVQTFFESVQNLKLIKLRIR